MYQAMQVKARLLRSVLLTLIVAFLGSIVGSLFSFILHLTTLVLVGHYTNDSFAAVMADMPLSLRVALPVVGGLLVGFLAYVGRVPEVYGEGVRRIREAADRGDGLVRSRVAPAKFAATLATLATGGSAGREGPMIMIGAAIGSFVGQWGAETKKDRDRLLLVGVAATIAATFGTPLTSIVLVVELLRRAIDRSALAAVAVASVLSAGLARYGFGVRGLDVSGVTFVSFSHITDLLLAVVFGILAGLVAICSVYGIRAIRLLCIEIPLPDFLMPALGGLLVGILSCFTPYLYEPALLPWLSTAAEVPLLIILMVLLLKVVATCITLGSGGSGGIFAPSLMFGAILGMAVIAGAAAWGWTIAPLYMLVAMAGVIAGITQLPLTAALLLMEASGHLTLLPLLLIAAYTAHIVARTTHTPSIYQESES